MRILKAGALYFVLVFGVGFVLGTIRVLWLVPRFGERTAELLETPFMWVAMGLAAHWVVRRFALPPRPAVRLGVGLLALGLLLATEFTVVLWLRGLTMATYLANRDPLAGAVYAVGLGLFAVMPLLAARKQPLTAAGKA